MSDDAPLFLESQTRRRVQMHPVVVLSIIDHFSRRPKNQKRVIGTLLGSVNAEGVVDVRDSFPVPFTEVDTVAVDMQFHRTMMELYSKSSPTQKLVGWYATGHEINENSALIHDFYIRESGDLPVHVTVDLQRENVRVVVSGHVGISLTLGQTVGSLFYPIEATISGDETEKLALEMLSRAAGTVSTPTTSGAQSATTNGVVLAELGHVDGALRRLAEQLRALQRHASRIASGEIESDAKLGAALFDAVQAMPSIDPLTFDRLFNNGVQDLLMVSYLAKLSRAQLALAQSIASLT